MWVGLEGSDDLHFVPPVIARFTSAPSLSFNLGRERNLQRPNTGSGGGRLGAVNELDCELLAERFGYTL
jgi:hypothetical protein